MSEENVKYGGPNQIDWTAPLNMMLVDSYMGPYKTFALVPLDSSCPWVEVIFEPTGGTLIAISKEKKQTYKMLPKLDDNGDPQELKLSKRNNGQSYKEERRLVETFHEIVITGLESTREFVKQFAVNADSYDYERHMQAADKNVDQKTGSLTSLPGSSLIVE
jgi:hypothetical protein